MKPQTVKPNRFHFMKRVTRIIAIIFVLLTAIVAVSQWRAHTPPILGDNGNPLAGSIASLEKMMVNGVKQWLLSCEYQVFETKATTNQAYIHDGDLMKLMRGQPEYGWLDRVRNLLGLKNIFNVVCPQLQDFDFREDATKLDLPIYLISGRNDNNAPTWLTEEYFSRLEVPVKQRIYF